MERNNSQSTSDRDEVMSDSLTTQLLSEENQEIFDLEMEESRDILDDITQLQEKNINSTTQSEFSSSLKSFLSQVSDSAFKVFLSSYYYTVDFLTGDKTIWYNITTNENIEISAKNSIIIKKDVYIIAADNASITLKSGMQGNGKGTVKIEGNDQPICLDKGILTIYYNPGPINTPKYTNPYFYEKHVCKDSLVKSYMWINNVYDLQNIRTYLSGSYALIKNISSAEEIEEINHNAGFLPIFLPRKFSPFSGEFDGLGHSINNLRITCGETDAKNPAYDGCGIFGRIAGAYIHNVILNNCSVSGDHYVGVLFGTGIDAKIDNITISNSLSNGIAIVGILGGQSIFVNTSNILYSDNNTLIAEENYYSGTMIGAYIDFS